MRMPCGGTTLSLQGGNALTAKANCQCKQIPSAGSTVSTQPHRQRLSWRVACGPASIRMIVHTYVSMILFCWRREQTNSHQLTETPQTKNVMARTTSLIISYDNMIMLSQCVPAGGGFVWAVDKAAILSGK